MLAGVLAEECPAGQEGAQAQQQKAGLVKADAQEQAAGFIPGVGFKILAGAGIQQIHQMRVVRLGETVNQLADQQVGIQFEPQGVQLAAGTAIQDGLGHAHGAPESGNNSAHRRDLNVAGGVAHQINIAARQAVGGRESNPV